MKILAVETSTSAASAALMIDNKLSCEYLLNDGKKHSEKLINLIDLVLANQDIGIRDIDAFAYSMGPGSFTGLRIGAAAIKGMAQAMDRPIIPIPTLDALAYNMWGYRGFICPILDAQRDMVYSSLYCSGNGEVVKLENYRAIKVEDLINSLKNYNDLVFLGDGVLIYKDMLEEKLERACFAPSASLFPKASSLASLASLYLKKGNVLTYKDLKIDYIRKSHAEVEYIKKHKIVVDAMDELDVKEVYEIEKMSFETPWPEDAFLRELDNNSSKYLVAKIEDKVIAYGGMWIILDEAHITNIAVHKDFRDQGVGKAIVHGMIKTAKENGVLRMTLEVRPSNDVAVNLYKKFGFEVMGVRKRYYSDNNEDALIMWKNV